MNILLFVMSLLMILALLTYGRLDMYRSFIVTQGEFERYMVNGERDAINMGAQQWYDWTALTQKNAGPKKQAPSDASPKVPLSGLFNPQNPNPQLETAYKELFKKLIYNVFGHEKEFEKAIDKNPNLVDDLINAMQMAGNRLILEKKPIKTTDSLENLDLDNSSLQDIYYWMMKGYHLEKPNRERAVVQKPILEIIEETGDKEEPAGNQGEEHLHKEGTISLLDFVTMNPGKSKIRVFLAPRAILLTLFDPSTVDELMQNRMEIYYQLKSDKENESLSEQFKQKFASRAMNIPENVLDFTVTGTDPRLYEVQ